MRMRQEITKKILDYNKKAQNLVHRALKVDKGKSKPKIEESIAKRAKLKNEKIAEIKKEEKNYRMNCLSTTLLIIKNQAICIKNYAIQKVK